MLERFPGLGPHPTPELRFAALTSESEKHTPQLPGHWRTLFRQGPSTAPQIYRSLHLGPALRGRCQEGPETQTRCAAQVPEPRHCHQLTEWCPAAVALVVLELVQGGKPRAVALVMELRLSLIPSSAVLV